MLASSKSTTSTTTAVVETQQAENSNRYTSKRSLSESSVEEYHRSSEKPQRNGRSREMWRNELVVNPNSKTAQPSRKQSHRKSFGINHFFSNWLDIAIRVVLTIIFFKLETSKSFRRKIQLEEMWLYKNPRTSDYVSPAALFLSVILGPFFTTLLHLFVTKDRRDFRAASWTWTLCLCLNGLITSLLKITVGRPRPDFFYRCFPDGVMVLNNASNSQPLDGNLDVFNCTGNSWDINEGHKSFPSGHASFAFASFGFISFYLAAKLHTFNPKGRGQTWRLFIVLTPFFLAALIAVSRTCDYHHHWQDVLAGGIIGISTSFLVYRQYYPSLFLHNCDRLYPRLQIGRKEATGSRIAAYECIDTDDADEEYETPSSVTRSERRPLIGDSKPNNKWI